MQLVLDAFSENESQNTFAIPIFSTLHTKICITIFDVFDDGVTSSKTTKVPLFQLGNEQRKQSERENPHGSEMIWGLLVLSATSCKT